MIGVLPTPSIQVQPPVQTSAIVGMPTQISTIKLPVNAVPSAVYTETVFNNSRSASALRNAASLGSASVAAGNTALMTLVSGVDFRPSVQFSSPFLAQLFSQNTGSQLSTLANFFVNDNAPRYIADPAMMELFSQVKYKPSNAFMPTPEPASVARQQQQQIMQQLSEQKAQQIQSNVRMASETQATQAPRQIAIQLPPELAAQPSARTGAHNMQGAASIATGRAFRSLVQPTGVDAYIAAFTRNYANLNTQPDIVRIAL